MTARRLLTRKKTRERFLGALRAGSSIAAAARSAGITRQTAWLERERDEAFAAEMDEAINEGTDALEDAALLRAKDGVQRAIYYQGDVVGEETILSDTLLIFLLKARRPEKYRERYDLTNSDGTLRDFATAMRILERDSDGSTPTAHTDAVH